MARPTKEEVGDSLATLNNDGLEALTKTEIREMIAAYLEQMEELEKIEKRNVLNGEVINTMSQNIYERQQEIKVLQAESQTLLALVDYTKGRPTHDH